VAAAHAQAFAVLLAPVAVLVLASRAKLASMHSPPFLSTLARVQLYFVYPSACYSLLCPSCALVSFLALDTPIKTPQIMSSVKYVLSHHLFAFRFGIAGNSLGHVCVRRRVPSKGTPTQGATAKDKRGKLSPDQSSSADRGADAAAVSPVVPQSELKAGALTEGDLAGDSENARAIRRMVRKARASAAGGGADGTSTAPDPAGAASTTTATSGTTAEPAVEVVVAGASLKGASPHKTENHGSGLVWLPSAEPPGGAAAAAAAPEAMLDLSPREQRIRARRSERKSGSQAVEGASSSSTGAPALTAVPARRAIPAELRAHGEKCLSEASAPASTALRLSIVDHTSFFITIARFAQQIYLSKYMSLSRSSFSSFIFVLNSGLGFDASAFFDRLYYSWLVFFRCSARFQRHRSRRTGPDGAVARTGRARPHRSQAVAEPEGGLLSGLSCERARGVEQHEDPGAGLRLQRHLH